MLIVSIPTLEIYVGPKGRKISILTVSIVIQIYLKRISYYSIIIFSQKQSTWQIFVYFITMMQKLITLGLELFIPLLDHFDGFIFNCFLNYTSVNKQNVIFSKITPLFLFKTAKIVETFNMKHTHQMTNLQILLNQISSELKPKLIMKNCYFLYKTNTEKLR